MTSPCGKKGAAAGGFDKRRLFFRCRSSETIEISTTADWLLRQRRRINLRQASLKPHKFYDYHQSSKWPSWTALWVVVKLNLADTMMIVLEFWRNWALCYYIRRLLWHGWFRGQPSVNSVNDGGKSLLSCDCTALRKVQVTQITANSHDDVKDDEGRKLIR